MSHKANDQLFDYFMDNVYDPEIHGLHADAVKESFSQWLDERGEG